MGIFYGDISWKFIENRGIQLYPHYIPIIITNTVVHVPSSSKEVFGSMGLCCWDLPAANPWNNAEAAETVLTIDGYHK
jgi:hypothetical protein